VQYRHFIMDHPPIPDPLFRQAVSAIDAGDVIALERLLTAHPRLVRERLDYGEDTSDNRICFGLWQRIRSGMTSYPRTSRR
jgi:hypothetical protein